MSTSTRSAKGRGRSTALSRDSILESAITVIERDGVAALSMRRLGDELGVDATAFYRHFRDKDDLVLAAYDRVTGELAAQIRTIAPDVDWRTRLHSLAWGSWQLAARYPALFSLGWTRTTGGEAESEIVEYILAALASTGMTADQVVLHYRMFGDTTLALCGMAASVAAMPAELRGKDAAAWTRIYAVLPQAEYPAARAHAAELATVGEEDIYRLTVEAILDRIEMTIASSHVSDR
jgi:AcrR family transcriptional regulator